MTTQVGSREKFAGRFRCVLLSVHPAHNQAPARHRLRVAGCLLVCAIGALRFAHLEADFPNDSIWAIDQAKFTDEGWWGGAAVMHALTGHWYVAGDYNPAVALPVWPLLLSAVFHFTGVSVIAARTLNVAISLATLGLVFVLLQRHTRSGYDVPPLAAALVLALSPFAFVFSRIAILDSLVIFEFCLCLLVVSFTTSRRLWPLAGLSILVFLMLITKTTSAVLIPSVFWLAWSAMGRKVAASPRAALAVAIVPAALIKGYAALVSAMGYGADYKYFYFKNALEDFDWRQSFNTLIDLLRNCLWIDRLLFPVALVILVFTVVWNRKLWSNPLFAASWLALGGQACFLFRLQDNYAPRYFLVMLVPIVCVVALALDDALAHSNATPTLPNSEAVTCQPASPSESRCSIKIRGGLSQLQDRSSVAAVLLLTAMAASAAMSGVIIAKFVTHPTRQFYDAANSIRQIVRSDPEQNQLISGVSGSELSLMTGIPSINDDYGPPETASNATKAEPGWYLAWTGLSSDDIARFSAFHLEKVAAYPVFDDLDRTPLILYKKMRRVQ
jgi:4-amino-4-deoxy-L-arabinose transferase-like glycosyltransferase